MTRRAARRMAAFAHGIAAPAVLLLLLAVSTVQGTQQQQPASNTCLLFQPPDSYWTFEW